MILITSRWFDVTDNFNTGRNGVHAERSMSDFIFWFLYSTIAWGLQAHSCVWIKKDFERFFTSRIQLLHCVCCLWQFAYFMSLWLRSHVNSASSLLFERCLLGRRGVNDHVSIMQIMQYHSSVTHLIGV